MFGGIRFRFHSIANSSSSASAAAEAAAETSSSSAPPSASSATAKGVNYLKSGSDPVIPSTLPEWISEVSSAPTTAFELRRALEQSSAREEQGSENDGRAKSLTGSLGARGTRQLLKLEARARIKERNSVKAKK